MIIAIGDVLIFLAMTFVGDHALGLLPSFIFVWAVLVIYRMITGLEIQSSEFKLQQYMFLFFSPYMIWGIFTLDTYYYAFFQTVLYINVFSILSRLINNKYSIFVLMAIFSFMTAMVVMFGGGDRWISNETFIFGPNIMYRIYGLMFFTFFYMALKSNKSQRLSLIVVFLLSIVCLISTGSRGALIILFMELLAVIYYFREKKYVRYLTYISIAIIIYYIIEYWDIINPLLGRVIYFDAENASENARFSMYTDFMAFLKNESLLPILFGLGNNNSYYPILYPHNILLEFIVYHGLVFFSFIMVASLSLVRAFFVRNEIRAFVLIFSPIIFGSMISGYFLDNFTIISLIFYCYLTSMHKKDLKQLTC